MKRYSVLFLSALTALLLAACGGAQDPADAGNGAGGVDVPAENPVVRIDSAQESFLAQTDAYEEFIVPGDEDSEYLVRAVLSVNVAVRDFRVVGLALEPQGDTLRFRETQELYALDVLTPEKPLVLGLVFYGDTPSVGVSYTDENGETRILAVCMSGEDGSLLLSED
ncbi:MAG: hypothetical protein VB092_04980 [Oscillospiraceae bacterium]|nr:hypothetical protein [Oscillospiraceae bacterium]